MALATGPPARVPGMAPHHQPHGTLGGGAGGGGYRAGAASSSGSGTGPYGAGGVPLVWVAAGQGEAGLWDVVGNRCRQVVRCLGPVEGEAAAAAVTVPAALAAAPTRWQVPGGGGAGAGGTGGGGGTAAAADLGVESLAQPQPRTAGGRPCVSPIKTSGCAPFDAREPLYLSRLCAFRGHLSGDVIGGGSLPHP